MALPSNGNITMAMINSELGRSATATSTLNDTAVRTLAGKQSGGISFSDFHGKSNTPPYFDYVIDNGSYDIWRGYSAWTAYAQTWGTLLSSNAFVGATTIVGLNENIYGGFGVRWHDPDFGTGRQVIPAFTVQVTTISGAPASGTLTTVISGGSHNGTLTYDRGFTGSIGITSSPGRYNIRIAFT